jgi:uncharacterized membrane protein YeaQ/YmgE (transglycosylase-associated protein family)
MKLRDCGLMVVGAVVGALASNGLWSQHQSTRGVCITMAFGLTAAIVAFLADLNE